MDQISMVKNGHLVAFMFNLFHESKSFRIIDRRRGNVGWRTIEIVLLHTSKIDEVIFSISQ